MRVRARAVRARFRSKNGVLKVIVDQLQLWWFSWFLMGLHIMLFNLLLFCNVSQCLHYTSSFLFHHFSPFICLINLLRNKSLAAASSSCSSLSGWKSSSSSIFFSTSFLFLTGLVRGLRRVRLAAIAQHPHPFQHSTLRGKPSRVRARSKREWCDGWGYHLLSHPTTMQPYYPPQPFLPPPLAVVSNPTTRTPRPMFSTLPSPHLPLLLPQPPCFPSDKKGNRQKGNKRDKKDKTPPKDKTGTPNTNPLRTSLSHPSKLHYYCHHHGWVTIHGWPSGHGGHHGDPCQFMKSRLSEFTPAMIAARTPDAVPNHPGYCNVQRASVLPHPFCHHVPSFSCGHHVPSFPLHPFPQ